MHLIYILLLVATELSRCDAARNIEQSGGPFHLPTEPQFILAGQHELNDDLYLADNTTPCGNPPGIRFGDYTIITVRMSGGSSTESYLVSYTCNHGYFLVGTATIACQEATGQWSGVQPTCHLVRESNSVLGPDENTDCAMNPSQAEIIDCFPEIEVRYKYSPLMMECERYLACSRSPYGFSSIKNCKLRCQSVQQPGYPVPPPASTPAPAPAPVALTSGGRRGSQCLSGVPQSHSSCLDDSQNLEETLSNNVLEILAAHNYYRGAVNPPAEPPLLHLIWDEKLAISAERWAAQCKFAHNSAEDRKIESKGWQWVGQNLCAANYDQTWTSCIESWGRERQNWTYGIGATPSVAVVGHYTQIVHAETTHIGCGKARCKNIGPWTYISTCNYAPGGNIGSQDRSPYAYPYKADTGEGDATWSTQRWAPTTIAPAVVPDTSSSRSGGKRGPQCLPGASKQHTSCLADSQDLVATIAFEIDEILEAHNRVRSQVSPPAVNMPQLQWSEELAISAERWAAQCRIGHDAPKDRKAVPWNWVGQNMRFSTSDKSWTETIDNWAAERANFRYGVGAYPNDATVGHYTQIIWENTTHVGCGRSYCGSIFWNYIFVCNYGPGGNVGVNGESPFALPYESTVDPVYPVVPPSYYTPQPPLQTVTRGTNTTTRTPWWYNTSPPTTQTPWWWKFTTPSVAAPSPPPGIVVIPGLTPDSGVVQTPAPAPIPAPVPSPIPALPPLGQNMRGGLRGSQCFPNVPTTHASCLSDSPNLDKLFRVDVDEVLTVHNNIRRSVVPKAKDMPLLQYSDELAIMAERWAAQCPDNHDNGRDRRTDEWPWVGQNMCWKSGADETWTECIISWGNERKEWQYGVGAVPSSAVVGHYTQIIWAKTLFVGCGKAKCKNTQWEYTLVCNYGPGGNVASNFGNPYATPYETI